MKRLCVYCGSNVGKNNDYAQAARELAEVLVQNKIGLVFGGSHMGIMGQLADAVLAGGGEVEGVIPGHCLRRRLPTKD